MEYLKSEIAKALNQNDLAELLVSYSINNDIDVDKVVDENKESIDTLINQKPDIFNKTKLSDDIEFHLGTVETQSMMYQDIANEYVAERTPAIKFKFADYFSAVERFAPLEEEDLDIDDIHELMSNTENESERLVILQAYYKNGYDFVREDSFTEMLEKQYEDLMFYFHSEDDFKESIEKFKQFESAYLDMKDDGYFELIRINSDFNYNAFKNGLRDSGKPIFDIEDMFSTKFDNIRGEELTKFDKFDIDCFFLHLKDQGSFIDYVVENDIKFNNLPVEDLEGYFVNLKLNYGSYERELIENDRRLNQTSISATPKNVINKNDKSILIDGQNYSLNDIQKSINSDLNNLPFYLDKMTQEQAEIVHKETFKDENIKNQNVDKNKVEEIKQLSFAKIIYGDFTDKYYNYKEKRSERIANRKAARQNAIDEYNQFWEQNDLNGNRNSEGVKMFNRRWDGGNQFKSNASAMHLSAGMIDFAKRNPSLDTYCINVNPQHFDSFANEVWPTLVETGLFDIDRVEITPEEMMNRIKGLALQTSITQGISNEKKQKVNSENHTNDQVGNDVDEADETSQKQANKADSTDSDDEQKEETQQEETQAVKNDSEGVKDVVDTNEVEEVVNTPDTPNDDVKAEENKADSVENKPSDEATSNSNDYSCIENVDDEIDLTPLSVSEPEDMTVYEYTQEEIEAMRKIVDKYKKPSDDIFDVEQHVASLNFDIDMDLDIDSEPSEPAKPSEINEIEDLEFEDDVDDLELEPDLDIELEFDDETGKLMNDNFNNNSDDEDNTENSIKNDQNQNKKNKP